MLCFAAMVPLLAVHEWFVPASVKAQLSTADHLADPGFWPSQTGNPADSFVGAEACAKCHAEIVQSQRRTPMAITVMPVAASEVLKEHPRLTFQNGAFHHTIETTGSGSTYSVTDGAETISAPLIWAFGMGRVGQSYLYTRDGTWYESRATYFATLNNLGFTPGRTLLNPHDVGEAMARPVPPQDVMKCFSCHATGVPATQKVDTTRLTLGISCEGCHGPGAKHVAAMQAAELTEGVASGGGNSEILNPRKLAPADAVDFCGACHTTWWDVKLTGAKGVATLRSQPYRLENSRCWGKGDPRITCTACHDPHQALNTNIAEYDGKCLACHSAGLSAKPTADHPGAGCPVATKDCVSCHMPKIEDPDNHYKFTDHDIRVVRANEALPQ